MYIETDGCRAHFQRIESIKIEIRIIGSINLVTGAIRFSNIRIPRSALPDTEQERKHLFRFARVTQYRSMTSDNRFCRRRIVGWALEHSETISRVLFRLILRSGAIRRPWDLSIGSLAAVECTIRRCVGRIFFAYRARAERIRGNKYPVWKVTPTRDLFT